MLGVFGRYVARQTAVSWGGIAGVLILVVVVNRFAVYLGQAAAGQIPAGGTFLLLGLSVVGLLQIVIPVSLFLAAVMTLGRLYRDSEATAAWTCGLTPARLYRPFALLALLAAILLAALALYVSPWAKARVHRFERKAQAVAKISVFTPGRFKSFAGGNGVFYAGGLTAHGHELTQVFSALNEGGKPVVLTARRGKLQVTPATGERHFLLTDGWRFAGEAGRRNWTLTRFAHGDLLIRPPQAAASSETELDRLPTAALAGRDDLKARAALEWRIAQPITALVLLLIAVPLAHARPGRGRYARLVPAILIYILYFNLLGVARVWTADGKLPWLWWVPAVFAAGGLAFLWWHYGRHKRIAGRIARRRNAD
jgi:lipopolysaccharide export system permease protein